MRKPALTQLIEMYEKHEGLTSARELAEATGYSVRQIRAARGADAIDPIKYFRNHSSGVNSSSGVNHSSGTVVPQQKEKSPHTPLKEKYINNKPPKSPLRSDFPDYVETAYEDIKAVYPKSLGGRPIKEKLHKLLGKDRELAQTIITAIKQGRGRRKAPDGSLAPWPNFSTWLNQQRWEDEPLPQPKRKKTPAEELAELMGEDLEDEENGHGTANGSALPDLDQGRSDVGDMPSLFPH